MGEGGGGGGNGACGGGPTRGHHGCRCRRRWCGPRAWVTGLHAPAERGRLAALQASPHVAGAAALYASRYPGATVAQIKNAILRSARSMSRLHNRVCTNGRLNIDAMLNIPPGGQTAETYRSCQSSQ